MAFELRADSGTLFPNERRREGHDDPNAQGQIKLSAKLIEDLYNMGGDQIIWASAWTKTARSGEGKKFQSVSVRLPRSDFERGVKTGDPRQRGKQDAPIDDDIPF